MKKEIKEVIKNVYIENKTEFDFTLLAIVLAFIFFWGEPDLVDALIHYFLGATP